MPVGPGKYDKQLTEVLKKCGARQGILIIIDGKDGPGFCSQLSYTETLNQPARLRKVAEEMEEVHKKGLL